LLIRALEPFKPAVTVGAQLRWTRGRLAVATDPYLQLGLANRDQGNRAALMLPLTVTVQPTARWAVWAQTGWDAELAVWRDGYHIPLGAGLRVRATEHLDLAVGGGFTSVLGQQDTATRRMVFVLAGWRT
jgi:hypothetical protein